MATNPYVNKVVYGNQTVIDISDTTAEENDVKTGKIFYKKSGEQAVGSASLDEPTSVKYLRPVTPIIDDDVNAFYLGDRMVKLRCSGSSGARTLSLVSVKDDTTESTVSLYSNIGDDRASSFCIERVRYITSTIVLIWYSINYNNSVTYKGARIARLVSIKADGTLVSSYTLTLVAAESTTSTSWGTLLKSDFGDFIHLSSVITTNTGAKTCVGTLTYSQYIGPRLLESSSDIVNTASSIRTYITNMNDLCPCARTGFFHRNSSGADYIAISNNYNSTARNMSLASAGSDIAEVGVTSAEYGDHFVLGFLSSGHLVTITILQGTGALNDAHVWIWNYDPTSTSNSITPVANYILYQASQAEYPICFSNDTVLTNIGKRYKLTLSGKIEKSAVQVIPTTCIENFNNIRPESSLYDGVFFYGD